MTRTTGPPTPARCHGGNRPARSAGRPSGRRGEPGAGARVRPECASGRVARLVRSLGPALPGRLPDPAGPRRPEERQLGRRSRVRERCRALALERRARPRADSGGAEARPRQRAADPTGRRAAGSGGAPHRRRGRRVPGVAVATEDIGRADRHRRGRAGHGRRCGGHRGPGLSARVDVVRGVGRRARPPRPASLARGPLGCARRHRKRLPQRVGGAVRPGRRPGSRPSDTASPGPTSAGTHDAAFDDQKVLVELDGLAYHGDAWSRTSDSRRDRRIAGVGWLTVRVVWVDVALHACATALDVGAVLAQRGWAGQVRACRRRDCVVRGVSS